MSAVLPIVDLRPDHWEIVFEALQRHVPDRKVLAFGSRATWTAKDYSDLDLVIMGEEPLPRSIRSALEEELVESALPFRVDIVDWTLVEEYIRRLICEHAVTLQSPDHVRCTQSSQQKSTSGPTDWVIRRIGEIGEIVGGGTPATDEASYFGGDIPWLTPRDLSGRHDKRIRYGARNLSKKGLDSCSARIVPPHTILLTTRAPIGYVAIASNPIATNQGFRNIIVKPKHHPDFIYYWLKSNTSELERHATGSTSKELSGSVLKEIQIKIPKSISEQRAIARVLGALDDKIELNRRMNRTLKAMSRALFKSWFIDFEPTRAKMEGRNTGLPNHIEDLFPDRLVDSELGPIPEGWKVERLDSLANFQNGLPLQKFRPIKGEYRLPVVKITQLRKGSADSGDWARASIRPECILENGDIVFSWSGSLIIRVWCGGHAALNQHLCKVTSDRYPKWFYLQSILSHLPEFRRIAQSKATTMGYIKRTHLKESLCVVASGDVLSSVHEIFANLLQCQITNEMEIHALVRLRDTVLPQLVSGKIRVNQAWMGAAV